MIQTIIEAIQNHTLNDITIQMLMAVILLDITTGVTRAIREVKQGKEVGKKGKVGLNSSIALEGILRNGIIILMAYLIAYFAIKTGNDGWSSGFNSAIIVAYLLSIVENWGLSGYKIPQVFIKYVRSLQEKYQIEMIMSEEEEREELIEEFLNEEEDEDNGQDT